MILQRLEKICSEEGVRFESGVLKSLIKACEGDLRRAITSLQSCHRLKGKDHVLTVADVEELSGVSFHSQNSPKTLGVIVVQLFML